MKAIDNVIIYSDGACLGNPGPGGYAALLILERKRDCERVVCGHEDHTTNNRMELRAVIEGLRALKKKCKITLYSDSTYVVKGMTEWIISWEKNNFRNARNKPISNHDLWVSLNEAASAHQIEWVWVKAHAGNELNERVDEIAREQALLAQHNQSR